MGRRQGKGPAGPAGPAPPSTPQQLIKEAEDLLKRAQRKGGADALPLYEQAVGMMRGALEGGVPAEARGEVLFDLGQAYDSWAGEVVRVARLAPLGPGVLQAEEAASSAAGALYGHSCDAYREVHQLAGGGEGAFEALVNLGNSLCNWAELLAGDQAAQARGQAIQAYEAALSAHADASGEGEEDTDVDVELLTNFGDCLVAQAEAAVEAGEGADGEALYARAMRLYQEACSNLDSARGEDLPGLLHNWGVGLHSMGTHARGDPGAAAALLRDAAAKLRHSASFSRGEVAPLNALGDVLVALAEAEADPAAAETLLQQALEEGYTAALRIDRRDQNAHVGRAEVFGAVARRKAAGGDAAGAAASWAASADAYRAAVRDCRADARGSVGEQCEVVYNLLCAVALGGGGADEAVALARGLLQCGGVRAAELGTDEDLRGLLAVPAFQELLQQAAAAEGAAGP